MTRTSPTVAGFLPTSRHTNLVIALFCVFLLCWLWFGLYRQYEHERQVAIEDATKETANFARVFEEHTLQTLQSADEAALFLKNRYEFEGPLLDIPRFVNEGRLANPIFVLLSVIDEQGDLVGSSQFPFVPANLRDREHFIVHKPADSGELFISKPVMGRASGKWSLQLTRRINKPDGTFGGVVVVSIDPFYFTEFYKQVDLGRNAAVSLVGRDGIIRARQVSRLNTAIGQDIRSTSLANMLLVGRSGSFIAASVIDGVKRIISYRDLEEYPLIIVVGVAEEEVLQDVYRRLEVNIAAAAIVSGVIVVFTAVLLVAVRRQRRAEKALLDSHNELEAKVEERTSELFAVNRGLAAANSELQKANKDLAVEIGDRKRAERALRQKTQEIRRLALTDTLTGLANRTSLHERLEREMARARRGKAAGAVVFVDLDDLKMVNDSFGHTYGDALIATAGNRIKAAAGKSAFVGRVGGDEFVIILPGASEREKIGHTVNDVITAITNDSEVLGTRFHITASAGIAVYPDDGETGEDIFKNADNAMYAAKQAGKNRCRFFDAAMQSAAYDKVLLVNELRGAMERGEFTLHYQPVTGVSSETVVGYEALLRWHSPTYGSVPPARFIPLAEHNGLIQAIGDWVLREACLFARRLTAAGREDVYVTVNVSPFQLGGEGFSARLRASLLAAGVAPRQLELEITENALPVLREESLRTLDELHALGVRLAIGGFGSGYPSLMYLQRLPIDTLKINKTFLDTAWADGDRKAIIGAVIKAVHAMGIKVVAEGVETEAQYDYLRKCGCDYLQGSIAGMPMPPDDARQFLPGRQR